VKKMIPAVGLALVAIAGTATVAQGRSHSAKASAEVCVLLPDTKSSVRWEQFDRPDIGNALKKANVTYVINNAQGDAQKQRSQADECLANGAKVLILTQLDTGSAIAIQKAAAAKGVKSIDYDRQVVGGNGVVYVSFDGHAVGVLQGKGVVAGLKKAGKFGSKPVVAELNGGQEDGNSFLFKGGYDSILKPLYAKGILKKGPDQFTPAWDNDKARTIFEQMLVKTGNKIDGVAAANDGLANAVVSALKAQKLKPIALSGQDATPAGVQNILSGWQTMTVYKKVPAEAAAVAAAAIAVLKGKSVASTGTVPNGKKKEKAILIAPIAITKANYKMLFTDKFLKKSEVCVGEFAKYCK